MRDGIIKEDSQRIWNDIMQQLHEPFEILSEALLEGIDHAGILMKFFPQPKEQKAASRKRARENGGADADVEESGGEPRPGEVGFSKVVQSKLDLFNSRKGEILRIWAKDKGLLRPGNLEDWDTNSTRLFEKRQNDQIQLFVVLYMEKLVSHGTCVVFRASTASADSQLRWIDASHRRGRHGIRRICRGETARWLDRQKETHPPNFETIEEVDRQRFQERRLHG